jgi:ectoine hydroxylase-related dioxygenase (phytanoyl-CoA dioxygenase family)
VRTYRSEIDSCYKWGFFSSDCVGNLIGLITDDGIGYPVPKGDVMLMRPLLLHASGRSTNNNRRRVIHIECSKSTLPAPLQWTEYDDYPVRKNIQQKAANG